LTSLLPASSGNCAVACDHWLSITRLPPHLHYFCLSTTKVTSNSSLATESDHRLDLTPTQFS
jgi:hypothetical protein